MGAAVVDLFCGVGGFSCGLALAHCEPVAGVDFDAKALVSYGRNFPNAAACKLDLAQCSPQELMANIGVKANEADLVVGGPPCQGFSKLLTASQRRNGDVRNGLVDSFVRHAVALRPKHIFMENVAEMRRSRNGRYSSSVSERLEAAGYSSTMLTIDASKCGVPQRRRRVFVIASRAGEFRLTPPLGHDGSPPVSVWDAIGDLPSVKAGEGESPAEYPSASVTEYQRAMRDGSDAVYNHIAKRLTGIQARRLGALGPGQSHADLPAELQVRKCYSGAYGRLTKDGTSPTITRWLHHPGSARVGHPVDARTITIREAARLQSFPDTFRFHGSFTACAGHVGNAVPPLVAKMLAEAIL